MIYRAVVFALFLLFQYENSCWAGGPAENVQIYRDAYSLGFHGGPPIVDSGATQLGGFPDANPYVEKSDDSRDGGGSDDTVGQNSQNSTTDAQVEAIKKQLMEDNVLGDDVKRIILKNNLKQISGIVNESVDSETDGYARPTYEGEISDLVRVLSHNDETKPDARALLQLVKLISLDKRNAPGDHFDYMGQPLTPGVLPEKQTDAHIRQ